MKKLMLFFERTPKKIRGLAIVLAWGLPLLLSGCVISRNLNSPSSNSDGSNSFTLSVTPSTLTVAAGGAAATATLTMTFNNAFTGTVDFGVTGLPSGSVVSFSPNSVSGASVSSVLSVSASASVPAGTTSFTVSGSANNQVQNKTVSLVVTAPGAAATSGCAVGVAEDDWKNASFLSQTATFTTTFEATPSTAPMGAAIGISQGDEGEKARVVIFSSAGLIQAGDGASDNFAFSGIPYAAGRTYRFRLVVDVATHTYSAFVSPPNETELTLGTDLAFPSGRNVVDRLDTWGVHVDDPPDNVSPPGALTVCNFTVR